MSGGLSERPPGGSATMYTSGNFEKYTSKNPLKRKMVQLLNKRILGLLETMVGQINASSPAGSAVRILDAGCGEGFVTGMLKAEFKDAEIVGLEYSAEAIEMAESGNPGIHFVRGDITHMPFGDRSFDIVLCTEVLEHLAHPEVALKEIARVARQAILLTVPHEPWFCLGNLLALKNVGRLGNPVDHVNHWTFGGFSRFLSGNFPLPPGSRGFSLSRSFPWTIAVYGSGQTDFEENPGHRAST